MGSLRVEELDLDLEDVLGPWVVAVVQVGVSLPGRPGVEAGEEAVVAQVVAVVEVVAEVTGEREAVMVEAQEVLQTDQRRLGQSSHFETEEASWKHRHSLP